MTPAQQLHEAIKAGDASQVDELLKANPELTSGGGAAGIAPLMLAIYMRQSAIVDVLLEHGASLDEFTAAALGRLDVVRERLLQPGAHIDMNSSDGWTPLHLACFFGQTETARALLEMGADVKARSANALCNTPLHAAAAGRHRAICEMLLEKGAEVNATQQGGYTPLHSAAANGDDDLVRLLLVHQANGKARSEKGESALDMAVQRNQASTAALLERISR